MNTAEILKKLREEKGLSQNEIAKLLKIDRTTYVKWETGVSSPTRKINELSQLFGVTTDYLLGNDTPAISATYQPSKKDLRDLDKFLTQTDIMFDGDTYHLNDSDREKIRAALKLAFWDAKESNKRKKKKD